MPLSEQAQSAQQILSLILPTLHTEKPLNNYKFSADASSESTITYIANDTDAQGLIPTQETVKQTLSTAGIHSDCKMSGSGFTASSQISIDTAQPNFQKNLGTLVQAHKAALLEEIARRQQEALSLTNALIHVDPEVAASGLQTMQAELVKAKTALQESLPANMSHLQRQKISEKLSGISTEQKTR